MITAAQLRAARGLLDWTRSDLAKAANVSPETIKNINTEPSVRRKIPQMRLFGRLRNKALNLRAMKAFDLLKIPLFATKAWTASEVCGFRLSGSPNAVFP